MAKGTVVIDKQACKGCGLCVDSCPKNVLVLAKEVNNKGYNYSSMLNADDCIGCANCALVCPDSIITVYREKTKSH